MGRSEASLGFIRRDRRVYHEWTRIDTNVFHCGGAATSIVWRLGDALGRRLVVGAGEVGCGAFSKCWTRLCLADKSAKQPKRRQVAALQIRAARFVSIGVHSWLNCFANSS